MPTSEEVRSEESKRFRVEFEFPLLLVKTKSFMRLYDRLGALRTSRVISWAALVGMPVVAAFGLFLIFNSILALLTLPEAREGARGLSPLAHILLPGVNPYLPIFYGWVGLIAAIVVHEGAHGVIARSLGLRVKSSGLLFFLAIPIGAFVDVDEEQLKRAAAKDSVRVMAAGPGANTAIALLCLMGLLMTVGGLTPVVDGLYIVEVMEGMPAEDAGLLAGDIITMVDDNRMTMIDDFRAVMEEKRLGDSILVTVARGEMWEDQLSVPINLTEHEDRLVIGVVMGEMLIEQRLRFYQKPSLETFFVYFQPPTLARLPFSDSLRAFYTHAIGDNWYVIANIFFWVWFVNVNVAIFNCLPIGPLDGGRAFESLLKYLIGQRANQTVASRLTKAVTVGLLSAIAMMVVLPYII